MQNLLTYISLFFSLQLLAACSSSLDSDNSINADIPKQTLLGQWQVESIDQGGIIDYSMITIQISANNRISGLTGCNNYTGTLQTHAQQFLVSNLAVSLKACALAVSMQEQRFLSALNSAVSYYNAEHQWLYILDSKGERILKLVPMQSTWMN